jgi:hypothetical protein
MLDLDPGYLIASMLVSSVGFVLFSYGKKQRRFPQTALGIVLLVYPYFVTNVPVMLAIGAALLALLFTVLKLGM